LAIDLEILTALEILNKPNQSSYPADTYSH